MDATDAADASDATDAADAGGGRGIALTVKTDGFRIIWNSLRMLRMPRLRQAAADGTCEISQVPSAAADGTCEISQVPSAAAWRSRGIRSIRNEFQIMRKPSVFTVKAIPRPPPASAASVASEASAASVASITSSRLRENLMFLQPKRALDLPQNHPGPVLPR